MYRQNAAVAGMRAQKRCRVESVLPDGWRRFNVTSHTALFGRKGCDAVRLRVYTHKHGYHPPLPRFQDFYSVYMSLIAQTVSSYFQTPTEAAQTRKNINNFLGRRQTTVCVYVSL